jgi:Mrp family chromosome partitioning ATPase
VLDEAGGDDAMPQSVPVSFDDSTRFDVVAAGLSPSYPAELLASDQMAEILRQWRRQYDYILIDAAPMLPVTDSAALARNADFTLVVARQGVTTRQSLSRTIQILRSQHVQRTGIVLNGVRQDGVFEYEYYGSRQKSYGAL